MTGIPRKSSVIAWVSNDIVTARVDGEIDIANAKVIGKEVLDRVGADSVGLVLDLSDVRYIDSAGIRMVFELARTLTAGRRRLALAVPPSSPVRRLLAVTDVGAAAAIHGSAEDAAEALRSLADEPMA